MNIEDKADAEIFERIDELTHLFDNTGCYRMQRELYQELKPYLAELHRRFG